MTKSVGDNLRALWARISPFGPTQQNNQPPQLLGQRDGYEPVNVSVAGVMYEDRSRTVLCCSLRERVWLCREPDNVHDRNAIKVVNRRGHQLGYIGRHLAARLAPYMDESGEPIEAVITELVSDVSGSMIGAKVGFHVPAHVSAQIRSSGTQTLDYYCDTGSAGVIYLMLNCDEAILNQVTRRLTETGLAWTRFGMSYRPATNGREYRWYVVLENSVSQEDIEQFLRDHFGVVPQRDRTEPALDEWIESFDAENANLKEENAYLRSRIAVLQEELHTYQVKINEMHQSLDLTERRTRSAWRDEVVSLIQILLPNIEFLRDSMDVITLELKSYRQVLKLLHDIATNARHVKGTRVEATDGWKELHFATGQKDDGRLYFKQDGKRWLALVSFKDSQQRDIQYLQKCQHV